MKTFDLGAVTAYALAVKYGFKGTEEEWVEYMQANAAEAKAAEAKAQAAAETAEGSETNADLSAQAAAKSAEEAKESAANAKGASDWHAAEGEAGHVLNRTHYVEQGLVEILPECQPTYDAETSSFQLAETAIPFTLGEKYTVMWNGVEYQATAIDGTAVIGEPVPALVNDGANFETGENLVFVIAAPYHAVFYCFNGETVLTVAIYQNNEIVHKLPGKFLPNGVPWVEDGGITEILPETTLTVGENGDFRVTPTGKMALGETYTIKCNGVEYECKTIAGEGYMFGNLALFGLEDTGEPFFGSYVSEDVLGEGEQPFVMFMTFEGETEISVSISYKQKIFHKFDVGCVPDEVPTNIVIVKPLFSDKANITGAEIFGHAINGKAVFMALGTSTLLLHNVTSEGVAKFGNAYYDYPNQICHYVHATVEADGTISDSGIIGA